MREAGTVLSAFPPYIITCIFIHYHFNPISSRVGYGILILAIHKLTLRKLRDYAQADPASQQSNQDSDIDLSIFESPALRLHPGLLKVLLPGWNEGMQVECHTWYLAPSTELLPLMLLPVSMTPGHW